MKMLVSIRKNTHLDHGRNRMVGMCSKLLAAVQTIGTAPTAGHVAPIQTLENDIQFSPISSAKGIYIHIYIFI